MAAVSRVVPVQAADAERHVSRTADSADALPHSVSKLNHSEIVLLPLARTACCTIAASCGTSGVLGGSLGDPFETSAFFTSEPANETLFAVDVIHHPQLHWEEKELIRNDETSVTYGGQLKQPSGRGPISIEVREWNDLDIEACRLVEHLKELYPLLSHPNTQRCYGYQLHSVGLPPHKEKEESLERHPVKWPTTRYKVEFLFEFAPFRLSSLLSTHKEHFTMPVIRNYTKQLLRGLVYLHSKGIIHGDVRPENVVLSSSFATTNDVDEHVVKLTNLNSSIYILKDNFPFKLKGSVLFLAPEIFTADEDHPYSQLIDIWALGCTVLLMMGRKPWGKQSSFAAAQMCSKVFRNPGGMPSGVPPQDHCPPDLYNFFQCCFEWDPSNRWNAERLLLCHPWIIGSEVHLREWPGLP